MIKAILAAAMLVALPASAATLTVVERATTNLTPVHGGKAKDNVGDILTFTNEIYDAANKTHLGADQGYCVRLIVGKVYECHWTLKLARGQLMVDGPFEDTADTVLAVTGGTGIYDGAHGQMKLHSKDAAGTAYDFVYELK
jgi:hypothetical protein